MVTFLNPRRAQPDVGAEKRIVAALHTQVRDTLDVRGDCRMFWIGIGATLVAGIVVVAVSLAKRPAHDLGSVSAHWIAEHRMDSP